MYTYIDTIWVYTHIHTDTYAYQFKDHGKVDRKAQRPLPPAASTSVSFPRAKPYLPVPSHPPELVAKAGPCWVLSYD